MSRAAPAPTDSPTRPPAPEAIRQLLWRLAEDVPPLEPDDLVGLAAFFAMRFPPGWNEPPARGTAGSFARALRVGWAAVAGAAPVLLVEIGWLPVPTTRSAESGDARATHVTWSPAERQAAWDRMEAWHRDVLHPVLVQFQRDALVARSEASDPDELRAAHARLTARSRRLREWLGVLVAHHPHRFKGTLRLLAHALRRAAARMGVPFEPSDDDITELHTRVYGQSEARTAYVGTDGRLRHNVWGTLVERFAREIIRERAPRPATQSLDVRNGPADAPFGDAIADLDATSPGDVAVHAAGGIEAWLRQLVECVEDLLRHAGPHRADRAATVWLVAREVTARAGHAGLSRRARRDAAETVWKELRERVPGLPEATNQRGIAAHYHVGHKALRLGVDRHEQEIVNALSRLGRP